MKTKATTHWEVRYKDYTSEDNPDKVIKFEGPEAEVDAKLYAMTQARKTPLHRTQGQMIECFEVDTLEEQMCYYTRKGVINDLTQARGAPKALLDDEPLPVEPVEPGTDLLPSNGTPVNLDDEIPF